MMVTVYQAKTGEQFTVTDEKPIGGFSQFGVVYAAYLMRVMISRT